ncbi:MAG TPA: polyprenyl synthetase family protein [Vicinamibacteria bacterium]
MPQANIPSLPGRRAALRQLVEQYVETVRPVPPLSKEELRQHTAAALAAHEVDERYQDYAAVLLNNHVWRESLAAVPYERRLLLLPKCLRVEDKCPAPFDELGLLCKQCGLCSIQDLQLEAEKLGYAVLVAEGSALVMALIQTGRIDAIVGVSCLSVLERAFPYMETAAIPGVAVPLLQDDCKDTNVDLDWVWEFLHLTREDGTRRLDLDGLKAEVQSWFTPASLAEILGEPQGRSDEIAREWLARAGKRWRPFLAVCAWRALQSDPAGEVELPRDLKRLAVAVECFHKASLVHDDIEDGDAVRYGEPALHAEHGLPVALNVGDLLLGEGYRLLAECEAPAAVRAQLVAIAAQGHRTLCRGQGAELLWAREPEPLAPAQVVEIFRLKTAPAFEVSLHLGAAYAGAGPEVLQTLSRYSEALGIAYQVRDDLADLAAGGEAPDDVAAGRPSLPLAVAYERAKGEERALLDAAWRRQRADGAVRAAVQSLDAETRCRGLLEAYKEEAVRALAELQSASLKGLLRRVVGKIFSVEIQGWCSEFEARNAAGRAAGAPPAG